MAATLGASRDEMLAKPFEPIDGAAPEYQNAYSLSYIAFYLGQIEKHLGKIAENTGKLDANAQLSLTRLKEISVAIQSKT